MKLTKYTHSCVRIESGDRRLAIDPGIFSEVAEACEGVDAVLITHQHVDHIDAAAVAKLATNNSNLQLWGPKDIIDELAKVEAFDGRLNTVGPGQAFIAAGLQVRTYGGQHALIHSSVPVVSNIAYLVGDAIYHPGDSYTVPNASVEVLLIPTNAPWAKASETYDFAVSVRAPKAFQIHDALLTEAGTQVYENHLLRASEFYHTTEFAHLTPKQTVDL
jgi:L-ascorbate metabolism protein UlaG (beta-lactamase superfamily)